MTSAENKNATGATQVPTTPTTPSAPAQSADVWVSCAWPTTEYVPFPEEANALRVTQKPVKLSRSNADKLVEHATATGSLVQLVVEDVK